MKILQMFRNISNRSLWRKREGYRKYQPTSKSHLTEHKEVIYEGRKYQCLQCNSQFSKTYMKQHTKLVHMGKKYPCNLCSYQASQKSNLKNHKDTLHRSEIISLHLKKLNLYYKGPKKWWIYLINTCLQNMQNSGLPQKYTRIIVCSFS